MKMTKEEKEIKERGIFEGSLAEAEQSLLRRFTEKELDALTLFTWQSELVDSLRKQIIDLELRIRKLEK